MLPESQQVLEKKGLRIMAGTSKRGFASMDKEKQRQIASKGGRAAHQKGTAHEFTPEEARIAGRKGGAAAHRKGTAHRFTSEEAKEAGRRSAEASRGEGAAAGEEGVSGQAASQEPIHRADSGNRPESSDRAVEPIGRTAEESAERPQEMIG